MNREVRNELRKKIENYSYGLNDHIDLTKKGNIFKGVNESSEERVAIKVIDLRNKDSDPFLKEQLAIEIEVLKKLKHSNIVRCLDIYSTVNNCYIITQFCQGGDLQNRIRMRGPLKEIEALTIFRDLIAGYSIMAQQKFIHGGLKPSSLLLKENVLKISGFGNSRKMSKPEVKKDVSFNFYQSPQSVKDSVFTQKSDIWSLGMILYVLLHGHSPWNITQPSDILQFYMKPYTVLPDLSEQVQSFIKACLMPLGSRLSSMEEVQMHPLVKKMYGSYLASQKLALNGGGNDIVQPRNKKQGYHNPLSKVEKHINCQINWMRFLFRVLDRFANIVEENSTISLKFIVLRQLSIQFYNLQQHFQRGQNPFNFNNWKEFVQDKDKMSKYKDIVKKNEQRYEKAKLNYMKLMEKLKVNQSYFKGIAQILNDNFTLSEYNCIYGVGAALIEIRRLWEKITKQYNVKGKADNNSVFKYKNELVLLDFIMSYYQLNCLLIDDFQRMDYFEKMSKLELILEYQPAELDIGNLQQFDVKLRQLNIIA